MDWLLIGLIGGTVAIYAMVDLAMSRASNKQKMIWFPVLILVPILGPIFYFINRKAIA